MQVNTGRRGRGRPRVDSETVTIRMERDLLERLDAGREADPGVGRPEAVRQVLYGALPIVKTAMPASSRKFSDDPAAWRYAFNSITTEIVDRYELQILLCFAHELADTRELTSSMADLAQQIGAPLKIVEQALVRAQRLGLVVISGGTRRKPRYIETQAGAMMKAYHATREIEPAIEPS